RTAPSRRRTAPAHQHGVRAHRRRRRQRRRSSTWRTRDRRSHGTPSRRWRVARDRTAKGRLGSRGSGSSPSRSGGSRVHLLDRVTRADLDAGEAAGAALRDDVRPAGGGDERALGAGEQAGAARRAVRGHGDGEGGGGGHGWYPRGVTTRPSTTRVGGAPTRTPVV